MSHSSSNSTVCEKCTGRAAMLRRGRNGRTRHSALNDATAAAATAKVQPLDGEEQESHTRTQLVDLEPEAEWGILPVLGESFCQCDVGLKDVISDCLCGEEDQEYDWVWDEHCKSAGAFLSCDDRKASFHSDYSCGTAAIRGTKALTDGQHFWEIKMTSPVYGTDMMVGVGTSEVNMEKFRYSFGSLLGLEEDSWGLSYKGLLHHRGEKVKFSSQFGQGSIIGVHLDTWHGTLTFYKNRHCIGVAATRLRNKKLYPMICSTAAKSSMKVIRACYTPTSLQYLCCNRLRRIMPACPDLLGTLDLPPGLRSLLHTHVDWVFSLSRGLPATEQSGNSPEDFPEETGLDPSRGSSPFLDAAQCQCPSLISPQARPCIRHCPPTPPSSDYDSCSSEPEDYQCKRCRWT
ncbi:SPRY domain-containing SOCS box protein 3 [Genypterus blacodes]|uniref:SPRY domain-containing SOCS box protein 3 n=1 Tax=Genypterus blacodes TaxID=154954 RepID=UPI003F775E2D